MSDPDIELNPDAVLYYNRLGVDPGSDMKTIRKAGKLAFAQYSEGDREQFLLLRSAREALQDPATREVYDKFCSELGAEVGTQAFETWKAQGENANRTTEIIETFDDDQEKEIETQENETLLWNKLELKDPQVVWRNRDFPQSITVNFWDRYGRRLYINNLYSGGNIYLDLDTGEFYTEDYDHIPEFNFNIYDGGDALYIEGSEDKIKIDLIGEDSHATLWDKLEIKSPELEQSTSDEKSINVSFWTKSGKRIYINGFHERGSIYIDLLTGRIRTKNDSPVSDIYYEIQNDGQTLYVSSNSEQLKISLQNKNSNNKTTEQQRQQKKVEENENTITVETESTQPWLQRQVSTIRGSLEPRSTLLLYGFNISYGLTSIVVILVFGFILVMSLLTLLVGLFTTLLWTLIALLGGPRENAIYMAIVTVVSFLTGALALTILEQFGIDL